MNIIPNLVPVPDPSRTVPGKQISFPLPASRRERKFGGNENANVFNLLRLRTVPVPELGGDEKANDFKGSRFPTHTLLTEGCVCSCGDTHTPPGGRCGFRLIAETRRTI